MCSSTLLDHNTARQQTDQKNRHSQDKLEVLKICGRNIKFMCKNHESATSGNMSERESAYTGKDVTELI